MLKMTVENVRNVMQNGISLENKVWASEWNNPWTTNCYAFILGLDVYDGDICDYAYRPGNIYYGSKGAELSFEPERLTVIELEERMLKDFETLGINCEMFEDKDEYQYLDELEHSSESWDILLFYNYKKRSWHFVRVGSNGVLFHKPGWSGLVPSPTDIENIHEMYEEFRFVKRYRLSLNHDKRTIL